MVPLNSASKTTWNRPIFIGFYEVKKLSYHCFKISLLLLFFLKMLEIWSQRNRAKMVPLNSASKTTWNRPIFIGFYEVKKLSYHCFKISLLSLFFLKMLEIWSQRNRIKSAPINSASKTTWNRPIFIGFCDIKKSSYH